MEPLVSVERVSDAVALLTLRRAAKKNALSIALRDECTSHLERLTGDPGLAALVVTGDGDTFSSGFDLDEFQHIDDREFADRLWTSSDRWHRAWLEFPAATVAAVNGPALAGGFDLAVMCDLRVAGESARFAHPEIRFGDVVYAPLHDLVGGSVARDLVLTGRSIDAAEALELGVVNRVAPDRAVVDTALELAEQVAQAPPAVLRRTKTKIRRRAGIEAGGTLDL